MEYKMNPKVLWECLETMKIQYQKMKYCYEEMEGICSVSIEDRMLWKELKNMEEQIQELWKLRRILERVLINSNKQEQKIIEQLEGKQTRRNSVSFGKVTLEHLSEIMEEMQVWIQ